MDHHVGDREIAEPEHVLDIFGLAAFHLAVLGRFADQPLDLGVGQDFAARELSLTPSSRRIAREALLSSQFSGYKHAGRRRAADRRSIARPASGCRIASVFGTCSPITMCSEENTRKPPGTTMKCSAECDMPSGTSTGSSSAETRRFADPAEPERRHGDAELAAGEIGLDVAHHVLQQRARRSGSARPSP